MLIDTFISLIPLACLVLLVCVVGIISILWTDLKGAPYVATPRRTARRMLELAEEIVKIKLNDEDEMDEMEGLGGPKIELDDFDVGATLSLNLVFEKSGTKTVEVVIQNPEN